MNAETATSAPPLIQSAIDTIASDFSLPPDLVLAICRTESGLDTFAARHEPAYAWLWDVSANKPFRVEGSERTSDRLPPKRFNAPRGASRLTEWIGQQTSWGLMQIMGAQAREYGLKGHFPMLCDVKIGVEYGCKHLAHLRDRFLTEHGWAGVIAAYNAGAPRAAKDRKGYVNQDYVDLVLNNGAGAVLGA